MAERYLTFKWSYDYVTDWHINTLERILRDNNIPFVRYGSDGYYPYEWVIAKGKLTWIEIIRIVNDIHAVKYSYISSTKERMIKDHGCWIMQVL